MKKMTFTKFLTLAITTLISFGAISTVPAFAVDDVCQSGASAEIKAAAGCNAANASQLPNLIQGILNTIIGICGLIAVIFIIIGGVNYMTSTGDPGKVKKAKDTILYAVLGLIIAVLAFTIVNFVIIDVLKQ